MEEVNMLFIASVMIGYLYHMLNTGKITEFNFKPKFVDGVLELGAVASLLVAFFVVLVATEQGLLVASGTTWYMIVASGFGLGFSSDIIDKLVTLSPLGNKEDEY